MKSKDNKKTPSTEDAKLARIKDLEAQLAATQEQLQFKENQLAHTREDVELHREKFQLALENSPIILFHQDDQLRYSWIYNAYPKISREKIIGKNDLEINDAPSEDVIRLHQCKQEVLNTGYEVQIEISIGGRWFDLKIKPIIEAGKVCGINGVGIDITDRKTSADIVERNQSILSSMINQGTDHVLAINKDFNILALNNKAKEDLFQRLNINFRLGENLGEKLKDFPDRQKATIAFFEKTFQGEKVTLDTYQSTNAEGKGNRYYEGTFFPIMDLQGEIIGGANINREVTSRVLLEQQMQEITKRSANLIGDAFFNDLTDQLASLFHMRYVYVGIFQENGQTIRTLAFRMGGKLAENFEYSLAHTPCGVIAENNKRYYLEKIREKFPHDEKLQRWNAESYVGTPITSPHTEKSIGILVMIDEKPWKETAYADYLLTLWSIRAGAELERMSAEQIIKKKNHQLDNISSNVPGMLYEFNQSSDGSVRFSYVSEVCERIFELSQEDFQNTTDVLLSLAHPEDKERLLKEQKRVRAYKDDFHFEGRFYTKKTRQIKWIKITANCTIDHDGGVNWYGFMDDITPLKEAEAALQKAKNEAEKAAMAKEDFLATMSHEIRTPLNAIIGLSNLLLRKNPRPDQLENVKALKFSSESLMNLINDILDYSKMEAGKVEMEIIDYDIRLLLHSIRQSHLLSAKERNNLLEIKIDEQVPEMMKGDQVKLAQVLNNLVSNANKFTKSGKVKVEVELVKEEHENVYLHFAVSDNGIGISPENLGKIFEKFTQADSSTVRNYGGTGLGLSITKALLEMQHSQIRVKSEEKVGSVFSFTLKQQKGEKQDIIPDTNEGEAVLSPGKKIQILLVEDVAINRMVVQQYIEEWWHIGADEATNGIEAVEMVKNKEYDIILMDIRMPEMDGYEASEHIRKLGAKQQHIPIVALTADTTTEFNNDKRAKYINDVITKPFSAQELYTKISQYTADGKQFSDLPEIENKREIPEEEYLLKLDFEKAEAPFQHAPEKIVKFYEMAMRSLASYRENYLLALRNQDKKLISNAMHKVKLLMDMLGLETFYEKMYSTRKKMEAGTSAAIVEEESKDINDDLDKVLVGLQERLDIMKKNL